MDAQDVIGKVDKEKLIDKFVYEMPILRKRLDMSQDDIGEIVGISRQTYSGIETRKRKMTWSNYMALLFFFYFNPATRDAVESAGIFPDELKEAMMTNQRQKLNEEDV